jgi:4-hydroxy-3-methylbut-2-enyl diphosphate reductase
MTERALPGRGSAAPIVCTPLRVEYAAVRAGLPNQRVVRTGMGPRATRRRGARVTGNGPMVVLGVAGGLAPQVRPGDLVVASEVRGDGRTIACPSAVLLAGALRRAGLRVHVGPIVSTDQLTGERGRAALATTGALAVDMESAQLAALRPGQPIAVVRAIVDTADAPMWRPGTARRGVAALRALRRAAPIIAQWSAAVADRDVALASPRSFCAGVERAIDIVKRAVERYGAPVYVRRQIVHNAHVVAELEGLGAVFVTELDEVPVGSRVVLAAHGVSPTVRSEAVARDLAVIDATCPLVAKVHHEVRRYAARDQTILLIGHGDHEEVIGTVGEAPDRVRVITDEAAARSVVIEHPERVAYVMQTTLAVDEADRVATVLRQRFPSLTAPRQDDICYATSNRQQALREIAGDCDLVLVVGSVNSSNSQRLVEVARRAGSAAYLIDDASDVDLTWLAGVKRIGVTAGASAPPRLVDELVDALAGLGTLRVSDHPTVDEDVRFGLPKEVS